MVPMMNHEVIYGTTSYEDRRSNYRISQSTERGQVRLYIQLQIFIVI